MKNAHLIGISGTNFSNIEDEEKFLKWCSGAYSHMLLENTSNMRIDQCFVLDIRSDYPKIVHLNFFENLEEFASYAHSPERAAYYKDIYASWGKTIDRSIQVIYQVVKRFNNEEQATPKSGKSEAKTFQEDIYQEENAPVILLKGLGLSGEEWGKYDAWVNEWAYEVYIPVLMKIPGVIEYNRCWLSNIGWFGSPPKPGASEDTKYPQDLSIIYFENVKAYNIFQNSKGLAAFDKNLAAEFPGGLQSKWDIAYQLHARWTR